MKYVRKLFGKLSDAFIWIYYFLEDAFRRFLVRWKKERKRQKKLKKILTKEEYQQYRQKRWKRGLVKTAFVALAVLLIFLVISGLVRVIGMAGAAIFVNNTVQETETETQKVTETEKIYPEKDITIGATGSMLLHSPFIDSYPDEEGNYDFSSIFQFITPYYSAPDFMTCEFEGALGGEEMGYSGYPNFKAPDVIIENLRDCGVDLQLLANNHIYDAWSDGFYRTMEVYEKKGIAYTGIRKNEKQKHYYVADIEGVRVGFMNYVYDTTYATDGPDKSLNGLVMEVEDAPLLNSFNQEDLESFYREIKTNISDMRKEGAQFIIANMHWGIEYQLVEADYQREIAQTLCDMGVDAILGGHPHCEQPIDVLQAENSAHKMFCIYSMGNALSNQRTYLMLDDMPSGHTEDGVMVTLHLHQYADGSVNITDVEILPTWVYRYADDSGSKYYILPLDDVENLEAATGISDIYAEAQASYERTMEELEPGLEKAKQAFL